MKNNEAKNNESKNEVATINKEQIALSSIFENENEQFSEIVDEFLTSEFLKENEGVEFRGLIRSTIEREINGENKTFAILEILTENGLKPLLAGQFKFLQAYKEKDKGNGVALIFCFKGLIKIKNGRTMNDFYIAVRSL